MNWTGKITGAALGLVAAGPVGALLGAVLGHQFDRGWHSSIATGRSADESTVQDAFFRTAFQVMGHIAKAGGRVTEEDIRAARAIMYRMHLRPEQMRRAIEHYTLGKQSGYPLQRALDELEDKLGHRPDLCRGFVELQMEAMLGGSGLGSRQRALLWQVASTLGVNRVELAQLEDMLRARRGFGEAAARRDSAAELAQAYRLLGVSEGAGNDEVKMAYRRLMNLHHPDKLAGKGQPPSMQELAKDRTREIRAAYDRIRQHRSMR